MTLATVLISVVALVLAAIRISGHKGNVFKDVSHLFVGGLFGAWLANRSSTFELYVALGLSMVELACFIYFKYFGPQVNGRSKEIRSGHIPD